MRRLSIIPWVVVLVGVVVLGGYANQELAAQTPVKPQGELVVLADNLGNEVWGPDIGGSNDHRFINLVNESPAYWAMEDQKLGYYPRLAERWTVSPDGLTWDFYLRKGIQFHGGWGEFTAEDVRFTCELKGRPGSTHNDAHRFRIGEGGNIESYTVVNPYHIRMKLKKLNVMWLWYNGGQSSGIVCKKYYEKVGPNEAAKRPIGTGSWRFLEHKPGEYVKFEAVENHWRKTPEFKYLTIKAVPEVSSQIAMLKNKEADVSVLPLDKFAEVKAAGLKVKVIPSAGTLHLQMGGTVLPTREKYDPTCPWVYHQDEPWNSEWNQRAYKVRKAICLAINKNAIIDKILQGEGEQSPLMAWPITTGYARPEWKPWPYDPAQAKKLLAEAGYPNGFAKPITFVLYPLPQFPAQPQVGMAVANDLEAIGLKINRTMSEWPVWRPRLLARDNAWHMYINGFGVAPEYWLNPAWAYYSKSSFLEAFECLELDALLDKCQAAVDFEARRQAAYAVGDFMYNHISEASIGIRNSAFAISPKIKDWKVQRNIYVPSDFEFITRAK